MGIVDEAALHECEIGRTIKKEAGTDAMYVFCHVGNRSLNRMMPHHDLRLLSAQFFLRQGVRRKYARGYRRNLASTPMQKLMIDGATEKIPGAILTLSRMGGWALKDAQDSTMFEVYTAQTADMGGTHHLHACSGRTDAVHYSSPEGSPPGDDIRCC